MFANTAHRVKLVNQYDRFFGILLGVIGERRTEARFSTCSYADSVPVHNARFRCE